MSATQLPASDAGEDLHKQFRKAVVSGGPLKGAQFFDVSWEDLKRAAKSYRADPRFNQFAKRRVSQRALGTEPSSMPKASKWTTVRTHLKSWCLWMLALMRGRIVLSIFIMTLFLVLISRPLFYVVLAKGISLCVKLLLRRSVGLLVVLLDAISDEAATSLETTLIAPPSVGPAPAAQNIEYQLQQHHFFYQWILHGFFGVIGAFIGHYLRAQQDVRNHRPVTSLRLRL